MKRRTFLQQIALFTGGLMIPVGANGWVSQSFGKTLSSKKLIVVFLRGGVDGLSVIVPHQEDEYYDYRPSIALAEPNEKNGVLDLDGYFGLHPALKDLMPLWKKKELTFIHGCGLTTNTRSHFQAQFYMENGNPGDTKMMEGWMNRFLGILSAQNPTQAVNVGLTTPHILNGSIPIANLPRGKDSIQQQQIDRSGISQFFDQLYSGDDDLSLAYQQGRKAREIFMKELEKDMMEASKNAPSSSQFVQEAKQMATLMKGKANTQLGFIDLGQWDTHVNQSTRLNQLLKPLGEGLATLVKELGDTYNDTTIVVMSEFGRTVKENGNKGTDHGRGNPMWIIGKNVKGGQFYGEWATLEENQLFEGRDVGVTTDFREPISNILKTFNLSDQLISQVFPNFIPQNNLNFLSST
ncbi:DUF1501 domain-containing protein [Geminocystis sp. CENA526]|uniref:DUF1501 domain-containing protein n=1 Tax=Geminocystis sp. CENA526 TaxID=1355871 RepID=UPI003D6F106C